MEFSEYKCLLQPSGFIVNSSAYYRIKTMMAETGLIEQDMFYRLSRKVINKKVFPYLQAEIASRVLQLGDSRKQEDWRIMDKFRSKVLKMQLLEDYNLNAALFSMTYPEYLNKIRNRRENPVYVLRIGESIELWEESCLESYKKEKRKKENLEARL